MAYLAIGIGIGIGLLVVIVIGILVLIAGTLYLVKKTICLLADFAFGAIFSIGDTAISLVKATGRGIRKVLNWGIL